ncbi:MAG: hypothetical protein RSF82_00365 [Angelakisella sp.]
MKRKLISVTVTIAALTAVLLSAGATSAYLTHRTAPVANIITLGNVKISLTEEGWTEGEPKTLAPDSTLSKKPVVTNTGTETAWVRLRIVLDSNTLGLLKNGILSFTGVDKTNFTWSKSPDTFTQLTDQQVASGMELIATYKNQLQPNQSAPPPFTGLHLTDGHLETEQNGRLSVTVTAEAVQTMGTKTADQCFGTL